MKQDEIVSKSQLKRIEMQKESREKMKQNEVVEMIKVLKVVADDYAGNTHINKAKKQAVKEAIRCVELFPELVRLAEESISFYFHDGGYPCLTPKDCYKCRVEETLKKAKELNK